ncbi:MAG: hypothetical protein H7Y43_05730, partial [Akkermansiaceae bacterium]|nr:hypothetical protein [Verrucomicrobiales bacterium]
GLAGTFIQSTSSPGAGGVAANFMIGGLNTSTNYEGNIIDNVGIIKVGTGTQTLNGATLTYTGQTTVSNGILAFTTTLPANSTIYGMAAPGILDISTFGTLNVGTVGAQTIRGNGTLKGSLLLDTLGTAVVGFTNAIGTLTVTNDVTLGGTTYMELNRTNVGGTNDQIAAQTITLGRTLTVTNLGPALAVGNTFKLFKATGALSGSFSVANLPATDASGTVYTWTDNTATDGSITVLTATTPVPPVNTNPTNITTSVSSGQITLSWPSSHIGWTLQSQTNALSVGLKTNWVDVVGSSTTNQIVMPIGTTNGAVFFRLFYPVAP